MPAMSFDKISPRNKEKLASGFSKPRLQISPLAVLAILGGSCIAIFAIVFTRLG